MMTIKEMSKLTGVSARALRYYDEIGLLTPTGKSEAGYRLYDEEALFVLQQILYFRELDIPLKTIKEIIENPALDRNHVLRLQKSMLTAEKERLERLIGSIDDALKGADTMDFTVFGREESAELFHAMLENMPEELKGRVYYRPTEMGHEDAIRKNHLVREAWKSGAKSESETEPDRK